VRRRAEGVVAVKWDRLTIAGAVPVGAVGIFAGVVSYTHVYALAVRTDQGGVAAHLMPLSLDGLIVAGSVLLLAGYALGWLGVALGVVGTLYANVVSMLPHGHLSAGVASWPAISFAVATFSLERWLKRQVGRGGRGGQEVAESSATRADRRESENAQIAHFRPPEPEVARCGHEVAGTPEQRVVQDYLHGRDCLGETPSQRHLAATHGLHRTKVAALVGPLNGHVTEG